MLQLQHTLVASFYFNCFMCFRHLFQMFHLDVSKVDLVVHMLQWLYTHVSSVSSVFTHMLHMFYLDVLKVDRVLHDADGRRRAACRRTLAPISHLPCVAHLTLSSPLAPLPFISSISPWQFELDLSRLSAGEGAAWGERKCRSSIWTNAASKAGWAQTGRSCVRRGRERGAGASCVRTRASVLALALPYEFTWFSLHL
jgi:hypothetical protein